MLKYIIRRVLISLLTMLFLIIATFFLMRIIPGSPFINDDESVAAQKQYEQLNAKYGLDKPLMEQFGIYMKGLLHGDMGDSLIKKGKSVADIIANTAVVTMRLGLVAFVFSMIVGVALGITAALSKSRALNNFVMLLSTIGVSVPNFLLAVFLMIVFAVNLHIFPTVGLKTPLHYVLPTIAVSLHPIAMISRLTRTSMMEVMRQDYMILAKSKGTARWLVIIKHGLRNALLPVVTYAGPLIASLLTGSFVVETLFSIPGIGSEFVSSVTNRDYTLIMGLTIFMGLLVIVMNLLSDLVAAVVDPRIKLDK